MKAIRLMVVSAALCLAGHAYAADEAAVVSKLGAVKGKLSMVEEKLLESRFAAADKDSDGTLTLDEAKAGMPLVARNFDKIDTEKKGVITLDQIKTAQAGAPAAVKAKIGGAAAALAKDAPAVEGK
jgi:hypothetical protein